MNLVCKSPGPELTKGVLGTKVAPNGRHQTSDLRSGFPRIRNQPRKSLSVSCAQTPGRRRLRPAAVAVDRESRVGHLENLKHNGAANGAIKQTISTLAKSSEEGHHQNAETRPKSVHDYMEQVPYFLTDDGGPPRWFTPLVPAPPADAPHLLFLPGMDGTGLGLILHHESLGRLFHMQCLHIPVHDHTPFTGLLKIVEEAVRAESERRPGVPIYLVGDSFGGALALSVAARNPTWDLVLVLANPATSFDRSQLQPLFPLLQAAPSGVFSAVPYLLSFIMGDPLRMAEATVTKGASTAERAQQIRDSLVSLLPTLPTLADVVPKEALLWKLKLLHSAALYTNSRLHAVRAEVLVLASGKDQMLPSAEEAKRLRKILPNCRTRYFKDSGHTLLLEAGLNLASVIKGAGCYRHGKTWDPITDFVTLTKEEFNTAYVNTTKLITQLVSPVFFSTSESSKVSQGLTNIPTDRPVLFVGNHMYLGLDSILVICQVFLDTNLVIRALAHPVHFNTKIEEDLQTDVFRNFGAVPVSGKNFFKLLQKGYSTLLYPGGAREALHRKGEAHKIFWPEHPEFVRMAARFGCTIVPMATVGEDELLDMDSAAESSLGTGARKTFWQKITTWNAPTNGPYHLTEGHSSILLDLNDLRNIPTFEERFAYAAAPNIRQDLQGEIADQPLHFPFAAPKLTPGRLYIKFSKPIITAGREKELQDKEKARVLYKHVQGEVERGLEYLQVKRQEDPYRQFVPRILYEQIGGVERQAPTFKP